MAVQVTMPKLGLTMTEARIVEWLVEEGEAVDKGQPLVKIETDKVVSEVESPTKGIVGRIAAQAGELVPVTGFLAWIIAPGEVAPPVPETASAEPIDRNKGTSRIKASPLARRMAAEAGLDLTTLVGTGPGGRIVEEDVKQALAGRTQAVSTAGEVIPLTGVRQVIAKRMAESIRVTARVTLVTEADATELVKLRSDFQKSVNLSPSYSDLLVMIVARALREHPSLNARLVGDTIQFLSAVSIGLAVDTKRGLLVPVIKDADRKNLAQIVRESQELIKRAREGNSLPEDLDGGTFTLTNLGMYDIDAFTPIINLPQCAILGIGRIVARPVVYEGKIAVRQMMHLSLAFDHRIVDGAPAARFLQRVKQFVENPYMLFYNLEVRVE